MKKVYSFRNFSISLLFLIIAFLSLLLLLPMCQNFLFDLVEHILEKELSRNKYYGVLNKVSILPFFVFLFIGIMTLPSSRQYMHRQLSLLYSSLDIKNNKNKFIFLFIIASLFFFITHGYCFLNSIYSHDSLMIFQNDIKWQISLGRFLQPVYCLVRGKITAPLIIGVMCFIFIVISLYLLINLFSIKKKSLIIILTGLIISSFSLILTNATYLPWSDLFMLSLLFSVCGSYCAIKLKKDYFFSTLFLVMSLSIYQAYIQVAIVILMVDIVIKFLNNKDTKSVIMTGIKYLFNLLIAGFVYYAIFKLLLSLFNLTSDSYNGLGRIGQFNSLTNFLILILGTYKEFILKLLHPVTFNSIITTLINLFLMVFAFYSLIKMIVNKKTSLINTILITMLIILLPFGSNLVYLISNGMEHDLMMFTASFWYIIIILILNKSDLLHITVFSLLVILIFNGIVFANQCYLKKDLEAKATSSVMTRVIDRIEENESYIIGKTPVVFIGNLDTSNSLTLKRKGFNYNGAGINTYYSETYNPYQYVEEIMGYPLVNLQINMEDVDKEIIEKLDEFPSKNCSIFEDGILYFKLSN